MLGRTSPGTVDGGLGTDNHVLDISRSDGGTLSTTSSVPEVEAGRGGRGSASKGGENSSVLHREKI